MPCVPGRGVVVAPLPPVSCPGSAQPRPNRTLGWQPAWAPSTLPVLHRHQMWRPRLAMWGPWGALQLDQGPGGLPCSLLEPGGSDK